jgi:hypothetical protein
MSRETGTTGRSISLRSMSRETADDADDAVPFGDLAQAAIEASPS